MSNVTGRVHANQTDAALGHLSTAEETIVLLTGSTGNLGSYILHDLLGRPEVSKIYCLNRSADAKQRQTAAHESRGLSTDFPPHRVQFLQADYQAKDLGLSQPDYHLLTSQLTLIIHNAWPVDFNRHLTSFEPSINGLEALIQLARAPSDSQDPALPTRPPAKFLFCSSISVASNWSELHPHPSPPPPVPEQELTDWRLPRNGYGQSKLVAERLLARAALVWRIPVSIVRIGQLAGPVTRGVRGSWPAHEWVPSLIRSAAALQAVPNDLGPNDSVDWVPVDRAAGILVGLGLGLGLGLGGGGGGGPREGTGEGAVFSHLVNPRGVAWREILPVIPKMLPDRVIDVDFAKWVDLLGLARGKVGDDGLPLVEYDDVPAIKLWDTFSHMRDRAVRPSGGSPLRFDISSTIERSRALAEVEPVSQEWMGLWMRQWGFTYGRRERSKRL